MAIRSTSFVILLCLGFCSSAASFAQPKLTTLTHPTPPKTKPIDPLRVFPGLEIPLNPEQFNWKIATNGLQGQGGNTSEVPVFDVDGAGVPTRIGSIPVGTSIKLERVRRIGRTHYYAVPFTRQNTTNKNTSKIAPPPEAWVSGRFIVPDGYASAAK